MEVRTKDQEMQAAELRLSHMEQDMVEMSTQNETYRSQVMNLTTQVKLYNPSTINIHEIVNEKKGKSKLNKTM